MSSSSSENEQPPEFGGPLQDAEDRNAATFEAHLKLGPASVWGKFGGPAALMPLILVFAAVIASGFIWISGSWQAGLTTALLCCLIYLVTFYSMLKTYR